VQELFVGRHAGAPHMNRYSAWGFLQFAAEFITRLLGKSNLQPTRASNYFFLGAAYARVRAVLLLVSGLFETTVWHAQRLR